MSTMAIIAFIDLDNSVRYVELVNDGDLAGNILASHYNSFTAAKAVTSGGRISTLKPALQNTIFHHLNWDRELECTNTDVDTLFGMADVIAGLGEDESPVYVFDAREYKQDFDQFDSFHYHKQYGLGHTLGTPFENKQYWKRLTGRGNLVSL